MNDASGEDLNWFWKSWFFTTWKIDQSVQAVDYVKTELMPDFNFDAYNHDEVHAEHDGIESAEVVATENEVEVEKETPPTSETNSPSSHEEVDKW